MDSCDLFVAVSPNGLGHARRVLGVLRRIHGMRVAIALEAWQAERFATWPEGQRVLQGADLYQGVMAPGPTWSTDAATYDDGRLITWEDRLRDVPSVHSARLVVGDNLAGVLAVRPDAVLMGSFLVSDVLAAAHPDSGPVCEFVEHERSLLAAHRPPMLCVGPIAMPGVLERTDAVPLPWMCEQVVPPTPAAAPVVAVVGGRTGAADDVLAAAAKRLTDSGVAVTTADAFDHQPESFARCHAVVTRPGLGTVHDCIGASVPIVAVYEDHNVEMAHNAQRLDKLGLGIDTGPAADSARVVEAVHRVLEPATRAAIASRLADQPRDGLDRAAEWMVDRLG